MTRKLIKNQWKCLYCGDIIESKHQHHFISCKCGKSSCDGGTAYIRLVGDLDMMQDMCEHVEVWEDGVNDVKLYVFDDWSVGDKPYQERYQHYQRRIKALNHGSIVALEHNMLHTIDEVITALDKEQKRNGEGIILRLPSAKWKNGRSTPKSQESVKLKFFEQQEYKIVDVVERMHNANEAKVNEMGYTERSSHKDNMIPMNTFGAFVMELQDGRNFNVGSGLGLTDAVRKEIWNNRDKYIGKIATVRQMKVGSKNGIPRLPTFVGLRDKDDMS